MHTLYILIVGSFFALTLNAQPIPATETTFSIHKKEKQQFSFTLQKGYTLRDLIIQKGMDLAISVYRKDDTVRLSYFDSPNGEFGPEHISFESPADGTYMLVLDPLSDDTVKEGK